jgi:hypothetical protein
LAGGGQRPRRGRRRGLASSAVVACGRTGRHQPAGDAGGG